MAVIKHSATNIDDLLTYGRISELKVLFDELEREMRNGNIVVLVHKTSDGSEIPTQVFERLDDLQGYRRRVIDEPLERFVKKINTREYAFERIVLPELLYNISFKSLGVSTTFQMKEDEEGMWKIQAQKLPHDVLSREIELHDIIKGNENVK